MSLSPRTLLALIVVTVLCGCVPLVAPAPTPAPTATPKPVPPAFVGSYNCFGMESGMGAASGLLTLEAGGVARFRDYYAPEVSGTWTFDARSNEITFSTEIPLDKATYHPGTRFLDAFVRPGAHVTHSEGGSINCQPCEGNGCMP